MSTALVYLAALTAAVVAVIYATVAPFWRTEVGRVIFALLLAVAITLGLNAAAYGLGDYPYREAVRVAVYGSLVITLACVGVVIIRTQIAGRRDRLNREDRTHEHQS